MENYRVATKLSEIKGYLNGASHLAFDFETAPNEAYREEPKAALDAHKAHIVGVSFSTSEGDAIYVPLAHKVGVNVENQMEIWEHLKSHFFENTTVVKIAHNLAFEAMFLYGLGIIIQEPCYEKNRKEPGGHR